MEKWERKEMRLPLKKSLLANSYTLYSQYKF